MIEGYHSYLNATLGVATLGALLVFFSVGSRRLFILWSGLLAAPTGLADYIFAPTYWQPDHIIGSSFSIEGILFSFGNGVVVGFLVWPFIRPSLPQEFFTRDKMTCLSRCILIAIPGEIAFLLVWDGGFGNLPVMTSAFIGFIALFFWLIWLGKLNLYVGLIGAILYSIYHSVQMLVWHFFDSNIALFWPGEDYLLGRLPISGLPGDEVLWAALYGILWPHIIAHSLGARRRPLLEKLERRRMDLPE